MTVELCIKISRYLNIQGWLMLAFAVLAFVFSLSDGVGPAPFVVVVMCGYLHFTASQVFVMIGKHLLSQRSVNASEGDGSPCGVVEANAALSGGEGGVS